MVSDLHLADIEDHADGWMSHKASKYVFDGEFAGLLGRFQESAESGVDLVLVLNGDLFDFDLVTAVPDDPPWPVKGRERRRCLAPTPEKSAWKMGRILQDHPEFVAALAGFLCAGHKVVHVLGNHDRELHFEEVRGVFLGELAAACSTLGTVLAPEQIRFEPWFYYVPGEIYAEHGQQYDYYTSYRRVLDPVVRTRREKSLVLPMGNISNRYLMSKMGYFNPHATDYILNAFRYLLHWLRHYALTRRGLLLNWLWGSILVIGILLKTKKRLRPTPPGYREKMRQLMARFDLSAEEMRFLSTLQRRPITFRFFRIIREFWIDRLVLTFLMTGGTIALALVPIDLWIKLMVPLSCFPLIYFIYEKFAQGETVFAVETKLPRYARRIAEVLRVPVVTFGHTHVPRLLPLEPGVVFVDTGTWAPIVGGGRIPKLSPGYRNYLEVGFSPDGAAAVRFDCWVTPDSETLEITRELSMDHAQQEEDHR